MALTLTQTIGSEVVTEKLVFRLVQGLPIQFPETQMELIVNDASNTFILQHLPVLGTNDTFDFEVNSILKDYFSGEFLPLSGANQTAIDNALVFLVFSQVDAFGVVGTSATPITLTVKNITQDTFEIEDFDLTDYDCGDAGNITSKLLTSSPSPLPIGDLTSIHVSCLTTSYTGGVTPKQEWLIQTLLNGVFVSTVNEAVTVPDRGISGSITAAKFDISTYRFDFDSSTGIDEVRFYIRDIASPFTIRSETKTYKLRDDCEKTMTLSWLNELGTQDSYTFAGNINRVGKYTDSTFKRVRPVNPLSTNVGDLVYKSSYNYEYDLFSDRIPEKHVEWLSKMLINKRAAIQEAPTYTISKAHLYNFFALNNGVVGDGRSSGGIVNTNIASWTVPTQADFIALDTTLGGASVSGDKMKQAGTRNWNTPNAGTNSSGFNGVGQGNRNFSSGIYSGTKSVCYFWTGDVGGGGETGRVLNFAAPTNSFILAPNETGMSVRLVRASVGGEVNGQTITNAYTGNNGKKYNGIVIGSQVWLTKDLEETFFNDSTQITQTQDDTAWSNLSTGSYSIFNALPPVGVRGDKYFPIVITTEESTLEDKFSPETLFRVKFRLANRRKGIK